MAHRKNQNRRDLTDVKDSTGDVTRSGATTTLDSAYKTHVAVAQIGGFNATEQKYLFAAPAALTATNFILVSDTATTGSDGSNNYTFQVANLTQTEDLLATAVTTNSNEIGANTAFDITPDQNATIAADDVLELQITKTGTPTDLSSAEVIVTIVYTVSA